MTPADLSQPEGTQVSREIRADIHCHCLPAIDDGPRDMFEAVSLCRLLVEDGITSVVASPHQLGRYDGTNTTERIKRRIVDLRQALVAAGIDLEIVAGADVRIDERLPALVAAGDVLTVGELGRHLLLELPTSVFCDPLTVIKQLAAQGVQSIMTHPERHPYLGGSIDLARTWIEAEAVVQITAGSLLGEFGRYSFDYAWRLVQNGLVAIVASDAHDTRRRPPRMTAAHNSLREYCGAEVADRLCIVNPRRIWLGELIESSAL